MYFRPIFWFSFSVFNRLYIITRSVKTKYHNLSSLHGFVLYLMPQALLLAYIFLLNHKKIFFEASFWKLKFHEMWEIFNYRKIWTCFAITPLNMKTGVSVGKNASCTFNKCLSRKIADTHKIMTDTDMVFKPSAFWQLLAIYGDL